MEIDVINGTVVYENTLVTFADAAPTKAVNKRILETQAEVIALWGDDNLLPDNILHEIDQNSDLKALLHLQARVMYAGGVEYELMDPRTYKPMENQVHPEIEQFLKRNWHYPIQATEDFYRFDNVFPQFTIVKDRSKIKWLTAHPANFCRYELQNKDNGNIRKVYINADWEHGKPEDAETKRYPLLNPMLQDPEDLRKRKDGPHYIYPLSYPQGTTYYAVPNWWALKKANWLELMNKIPSYKLALMKNQLSMKYHIEFPDTHWDFICPGFDKLDKAKKKEVKEAEVKKIVTLLQGEENAGKTIVTGYHFDKIQFKEYPGIRITVIKDNLKDGAYLEDTVEGVIKMFTSLGLDPSILGIVPGKGGSNRSGSDKREAIMMYTQLIQPHVDMVLRPYEFVADYNGWNNEEHLVRWYFKSAAQIPTLNKVTPNERENINPDGATE